MARFEMTGLDPIIDSMKAHGQLIGEVADRMLLAGAEAVKQAWREEAERRHFKDTGEMINSIGFAKSPKTAADVRTIDIYPQGKDKTGTRNAEKAFILHYGRSSRRGRRQNENKKFPGAGIPKTLWVDAADEAAGPRVLEVYNNIWDEYLKGK